MAVIEYLIYQGFIGFYFKNLIFNTKSQKVILNCGARLRYYHCYSQILEINNLKKGMGLWI